MFICSGLFICSGPVVVGRFLGCCFFLSVCLVVPGYLLSCSGSCWGGGTLSLSLEQLSDPYTPELLLLT